MQYVCPLPDMLASYMKKLVRVSAAPILIWLPVNAPGQAAGDEPHAHGEDLALALM